MINNKNTRRNVFSNEMCNKNLEFLNKINKLIV